MQPILILKTGETIPSIAEKFGEFDAWITKGIGMPAIQFQTVSVFQGEPLPPLDNISGIVITGSPAMVSEKLPWIETSQHYLINALNAGVPMLGICFGHQLMAQAFGGKVDWNPAGREIGTTSISLLNEAAEDPLFNTMPGNFKVHATHMQSIIDLPPAAKILASNPVDNHHAVHFGDNAWGVQFHPEFDEEIMAGYIRERSEEISAEGQDPELLLEQITTAPEAQGLLKRFAALVLEQAGT
jgi:GMP synthase (glutamine-hydrolysing)